MGGGGSGGWIGLRKIDGFGFVGRMLATFGCGLCWCCCWECCERIDGAVDCDESDDPELGMDLWMFSVDAVYCDNSRTSILDVPGGTLKSMVEFVSGVQARGFSPPVSVRASREDANEAGESGVDWPLKP